jgi:hypothetical protein
MKTASKLGLISYALIVLGACLLGLVGLTSGVSASVLVLTDTVEMLYSPLWCAVESFSRFFFA